MPSAPSPSLIKYNGLDAIAVDAAVTLDDDNCIRALGKDGAGVY